MKASFAWLALIAYFLLACLLTYPLILQANSHLPGIAGDGPTFVWSVWSFHHSLQQGQSPFWTNMLFYPHQTSLLLHATNFIHCLLAYLFLKGEHLLLVFNLVFLFSLALAGLGMYNLARRLVDNRAAAFVSGLIFAFSPFTFAHALGHFNMTAIFPFPWLMLFLLQWQNSAQERLKSLGAAVGIALSFLCLIYANPYYAVYGAVLLLLFFLSHYWPIGLSIAPCPSKKVRPWFSIFVALLMAADIVLLILLASGRRLQGRIGNLTISVQKADNLLTFLWLLLAVLLARQLLRGKQLLLCRRSITPLTPSQRRALFLAALLLLLGCLPLIQQTIQLLHRGGYIAPPLVWRNAFSGADAITYFLPNPFHPWWGAAAAALYDPLALPLSEKVIFPGFAVLLLAIYGWSKLTSARETNLWLKATLILAIVLSLGDFLHVAGVNTRLPLPFLLGKAMPLLNNARVASRWAILAILGAACFAAAGLARLAKKFRHGKYLCPIVAALVITAENLAIPYPLLEMRVPAVFQSIAALPGDCTLLELPLGRADGLRSAGYYYSSSMFFQTLHQKKILGGYLSRIPEGYLQEMYNDPFFAAILSAGAGKGTRRLDWGSFLRRYRIGCAVVYPGYAPLFDRFLRRRLGLIPWLSQDGWQAYLVPGSGGN